MRLFEVLPEDVRPRRRVCRSPDRSLPQGEPTKPHLSLSMGLMFLFVLACLLLLRATGRGTMDALFLDVPSLRKKKKKNRR